jgi:hypothetical protein
MRYISKRESNVLNNMIPIIASNSRIPAATSGPANLDTTEDAPWDEMRGNQGHVLMGDYAAGITGLKLGSEGGR